MRAIGRTDSPAADWDGAAARLLRQGGGAEGDDGGFERLVPVLAAGQQEEGQGKGGAGVKAMSHDYSLTPIA